ncbi:UNVERIFIED_CONTAM: hypothetical protein Sangu_0078400 [Sesamum angustifolium]|uniref:Uncharacterized protein n=1 Tax=Sesamum angustifolium TaxID=2727405 RepID=A0AAW2RKP3_9LAMI
MELSVSIYTVLSKYLMDAAVREAEHLAWAMRLRITMVVIYCVEQIHQLTPASLENLTNSTIYPTEDYAAKVSNFVFWDEGAAAERQS